MTALAAIVVSLAAAALVVALAVWDAARRALAAQVRLAELRVEAQRRTEVVEVDERVSALVLDVEQLRRDHDGLERGLALGRRR